MAQSKSFFGKRRGSTKNFTFTVFNGKQVTKEKAEQVKNPRTLAQMRNRMILTTSAAAYAAMKEIVDHSFQGFTYGLQNMSRFQSVNNKLLRENLTAVTSQFAYAEYGKAKLLPGAYQISEGSLSDINALAFAATIVSDTQFAFNFKSSKASEMPTANTLMQGLGISVGELATAVAIIGNQANNKFTFVFIRLVAKKAGDVALTVDNINEFFDIESNVNINLEAPTEGTIAITLNDAAGSFGDTYATGCIRSALVNGVWQRSTVVLEVVAGAVLEPSAETAITTYPVGGSYILNNGDVPNGYEVG